MMAFFAVTFVMPIACSLIVADGIAIDFVAAAAIRPFEDQVISENSWVYATV